MPHWGRDTQEYFFEWLDDNRLRPVAMCLYESGTGASGGYFRPVHPEDFASSISGAITGLSNVTINGLPLPVYLSGIGQSGDALKVFVQNPIEVTGGNIIVSSGNVVITNPVLPITGNVIIQSGAVLDVATVGVTGGFCGVTGDVAIKSSKPAQQGTYNVLVTGNGTFDNFSGIVPLVVGNPVALSIEPASTNTQPVFYAFSGTATTGDAWEIRGDRSFEVATSNLDVYFAGVSGTQRICVHWQIFN